MTHMNEYSAGMFSRLLNSVSETQEPEMEIHMKNSAS